MYSLVDADANDAFCGKIVLFSIGQNSNCTLFAFIWHDHEEQAGIMVEADCGYRLGVIVEFHGLTEIRGKNVSTLAK